MPTPPPPPTNIHLSSPTNTTITTTSSSSSSPTYLIYFIPGNPGLISYYTTFLTHLYGLLLRQQSVSLNHRKNTTTPTVHVCGRSLAGFECGEDNLVLKGRRDSNRNRHRDRPPPPYGLQEQIENVERDVVRVVEGERNGNENGGGDVRVILMGHSLGGYVVLEVIRRLRERREGNEMMMQLGSEGEEEEEEKQVPVPRVAGGVCLFPAVTHLAASPSGSKVAFLRNYPNLNYPYYASLLARLLTFLLSLRLLALLIRLLMRFPADAATTTAHFIKSPYGVHQAIHLARDELHQINEDTWSSDIWGAATPSAHPHKRPVLRFLFGGYDHWVANEVRDELIRVRGRRGGRGLERKEGDVVGEVEEWKPVMEVDETEGWPHGFCIRDSVAVAERVAGYVEEIVREGEGR